MTGDLEKSLFAFAKKNSFRTKGPLCVALVVTQHAKEKGLPLNPDELVTSGGGQVLGLGKSAVQNILNRHGIERVLASEGGRTSRGSLNNMRTYVEFLNAISEREELDLEFIESFWINRVYDYFAGKPFKISLDSSRSIRAVVRELLQQAEDRQKSTPGVYYAGAVMQHLVGAKLECVLKNVDMEHNSFSTADEQSQRAGDFFVGDVAIHVTTSPGEAVIEKCRDNINDGFRPILITGQKGMAAAEVLAENKDLDHRLDIFEIEQFMASNIYELGSFAAKGRKAAVTDIVGKYNDIVEEFETDPSLKIEMKK